MNKILAVSIGGLGDTVLFSPLLRALRNSYPTSQIDLLVASKLAQEVYSAADGISNAFYVKINKSSLLTKVASFIPFALRSHYTGRFDCGFFATGLNRNLGQLLKCAGVVKTVKYAPVANGHLTDLNCNVLLSQKINKKITEQDVFVPFNKSSIAEAKSALDKHQISTKNEKLIAVYPSIELLHRPRWSLFNLVEVIRLLKKEGFKFKTVVVGSKAEGKEWDAIDKNHVVDANLAGQVSILGCASILSHCALTIGNDGGIMHVAGAVGSPLVAIMTNTPLSYKPPGYYVTIMHSDNSCCEGLYPKRPKKCIAAKCTSNISIEEVSQACANILKKYE